MVGRQIAAMDMLHRCGASGVPIIKPSFYAYAVIGNSSAQTDGIAHQVEGNWASKIWWNVRNLKLRGSHQASDVNELLCARDIFKLDVSWPANQRCQS